MRIVCPACAAAYDVPDDRLATGRVVRCARCDTDWVPLPEPEAKAEIEATAQPPVSEIEPETEPEPAPAIDDPVPIVASVTDRPAPAPPVRGRWPLRVAWVVSVMIVLAGLAGAVVGRAGVMQAWPPSIRAYEAIGLARTVPAMPHQAQLSK